MKNRVVFRWMITVLVCAAAVAGIWFCRPARRETFSPLLADKFGVFLEISGKIRNEDRRTKAGEEMPLVDIHAVNGSPVAVVTLPLAALNPGTREKLRSLRDGGTVKIGGFESLEASGFPDVPGEPTIQHTGFGMKNVFVVMRR